LCGSLPFRSFSETPRKDQNKRRLLFQPLVKEYSGVAAAIRTPMLNPFPTVRLNYMLVFVFVVSGLPAGCLYTRGIDEVLVDPYPQIYQDDSTLRFGDQEDKVFIEVRKAKISRRLDNLAIHYGTIFPGGVPIRRDDNEQYVKVGGKTAYRVIFAEKSVRRRKRLEKEIPPEEVPPGWKQVTISDPVTGKPTPALYGPVVPRRQILYLVEGDAYLYYVLMRADGGAIPEARRAFEEFVRKGIDYR